MTLQPARSPRRCGVKFAGIFRGAEKQDFNSRPGASAGATLVVVRGGRFLPMQHKHLYFGKGFRVVLGNKRSQAAQMTIPSGSSEGGPGNRHRKTDQWLFVVSGKGFAIVGKDRITLRAGSLLLIERGEPHEIKATSRAPQNNQFLRPSRIQNQRRPSPFRTPVTRTSHQAHKSRDEEGRKTGKQET